MPVPGKQCPAHLTGDDGTMAGRFRETGATLQKKFHLRQTRWNLCRRAWSVLGALYVTDPADAPRINWGPLRASKRTELHEAMAGEDSSLHSEPQADGREVGKANGARPHDSRNERPERALRWGTRVGSDIAGRTAGSTVGVRRTMQMPSLSTAPENVFRATRAFLGGGWPEGSDKLVEGEVQNA